MTTSRLSGIRRRNKYRAVKTKVDGRTFDSKREANRYLELKQLLVDNKISKLEFQPKFRLVVNGKLICDYRADFSYYEYNPSKPGDEYRTSTRVVEDVKGFRTRDYVIKRKLMDALYNIQIRET